MNVEYLKWDSDFFGLKIGKVINNERIPKSELKQLLNVAKAENYSLIYVFTPEKEKISEEILSETNSKLVDRKIVYSLNIEEKATENHPEILDYSAAKLTAELLDLSYLSGHYSRFKSDKKLPNNAFQRLYKEWIEKSLNGVLADRVFVAMDSNKQIIGFVTLQIKESSAEIGLIAVSEKTQGKKTGTKLIDKCIQYLQEKSIKTLTVPTQLENTQACKFYEKYGFTTHSITNIYHFWI